MPILSTLKFPNIFPHFVIGKGLHFYDVHGHPSHKSDDPNFIPFWHRTCIECGYHGHTHNFCDMIVAGLMCTYCGWRDHVALTCPRRLRMVSDVHVLGYVSHPIHPDDEMALARDLPPGYVPRPRCHPDHMDYRRAGTNAALVWPPTARLVSQEARKAVEKSLMYLQITNGMMTAEPNIEATPTVEAGAASAIVVPHQTSDANSAQAKQEVKPRRISKQQLAQALSRRANHEITTEDKNPMAAPTPVVPRVINKESGAIPKRATNVTEYFLEQKASSEATEAEPQMDPLLSTLLNLTMSVNGLQKTTKDAMCIRQTTLPNCEN